MWGLETWFLSIEEQGSSFWSLKRRWEELDWSRTILENKLRELQEKRNRPWTTQEEFHDLDGEIDNLRSELESVNNGINEILSILQPLEERRKSLHSEIIEETQRLDWVSREIGRRFSSAIEEAFKVTGERWWPSFESLLAIESMVDSYKNSFDSEDPRIEEWEKIIQEWRRGLEMIPIS